MNKSPATLQIIRLLKHERTRVFSALTDPIKMSQWFFGFPEGGAKVTNDLRPGGGYTIEMTGEEGSCSPHGIYLEIVPPERLVFTWSSDHSGLVTSKVSIELFEHLAGTKLVLTHELPEDQIPPHREGWRVCFDHLELHLDGVPVVSAPAGVRER